MASFTLYLVAYSRNLSWELIAGLPASAPVLYLNILFCSKRSYEIVHSQLHCILKSSVIATTKDIYRSKVGIINIRE